MTKIYKNFSFTVIVFIFAFYISPILLNLQISLVFIVAVSLFFVFKENKPAFGIYPFIFLIGFADLFSSYIFGMISIFFLFSFVFMILLKKRLNFGEGLVGRLLFSITGTFIFYAILFAVHGMASNTISAILYLPN